MKLRIITKDCPYKGWILSYWSKQSIATRPDGYYGSLVEIDFQEEDFKEVEVVAVDAPLSSTPLSSTPLSSTPPTSEPAVPEGCVRSCMIDRRRRESAERHAKSWRARNEELKALILHAHSEVQHVVWVLQRTLGRGKNNELAEILGLLADRLKEVLK